MNTDIKLKHYFSRERYECVTLWINPDEQFSIVCQRGEEAAIRGDFIDPDTVQACVEACQWLIDFFPEHTEQIEHILADFFTLAHSCTGNVLFAVVLRELGKREEIGA